MTERDRILTAHRHYRYRKYWEQHTREERGGLCTCGGYNASHVTNARGNASPCVIYPCECRNFTEAVEEPL